MEGIKDSIRSRFEESLEVEKSREENKKVIYGEKAISTTSFSFQETSLSFPEKELKERLGGKLTALRSIKGGDIWQFIFEDEKKIVYSEVCKKSSDALVNLKYWLWRIDHPDERIIQHEELSEYIEQTFTLKDGKTLVLSGLPNKNFGKNTPEFPIKRIIKIMDKQNVPITVIQFNQKGKNDPPIYSLSAQLLTGGLSSESVLDILNDINFSSEDDKNAVLEAFYLKNKQG